MKNFVDERAPESSAARNAPTMDPLARRLIPTILGVIALVIALLSTFYSLWPGVVARPPRTVLIALAIEALLLVALGVSLAGTCRRATTRERDGVWLALLCIFGFAITIVSAFPGHSKFDEVYSLSEYWSGILSDLHPPAHTLVWVTLMNAGQALGLDATAQASLLLFAQAALFWFAAGLLAGLMHARWLARAFLISLALSPVSLYFLGFTGTDSQFAIALFVAVTLLAFAVRRRSRPLLALTLIPLFYGFAVRSNGPAGVLPLCFFWAAAAYDILVPERTTRRKTLAVAAIGVVLFAALLGATRGLSRLVIQVNCCFAEQAFMPLVYDLMGVSVRLNQNIVPSIFYLDPNYDLDTIKQHFDPFTLDFDGLKRITPDLHGPVVWAWLRILRDHPRELILHRLVLLRNCLGIHPGRPVSALFLEFEVNMKAIPMPERVNDVAKTYRQVSQPFHRIRALFEDYFFNSLDSGFFRLWVYIAALAAAFAVPAGGAAHPAVTWLTASAACYLLPYVLLANSPHFRYVWWAALAMFTAFILRLDAIILHRSSERFDRTTEGMTTDEMASGAGTLRAK